MLFLSKCTIYYMFMYLERKLNNKLSLKIMVVIFSVAHYSRASLCSFNFSTHERLTSLGVCIKCSGFYSKVFSGSCCFSNLFHSYFLFLFFISTFLYHLSVFPLLLEFLNCRCTAFCLSLFLYIKQSQALESRDLSSVSFLPVQFTPNSFTRYISISEPPKKSALSHLHVLQSLFKT